VSITYTIMRENVKVARSTYISLSVYAIKRKYKHALCIATSKCN